MAVCAEGKPRLVENVAEGSFWIQISPCAAPSGGENHKSTAIVRIELPLEALTIDLKSPMLFQEVTQESH